MDKKTINCSHPEFESEVKVFRLTKEDGGEVYDYTADLKIRCAICKTDMKFRGIPMGISPNQPMLSADGVEARIPIEPVTDFEIGSIDASEN